MTCGRTSRITVSSSPAASSTSARQKEPAQSLDGVPIIPESCHRPAPPRNRWSVTPSAAQASASSPIRCWPRPPSASQARCASSGGMISPSSPRVQVTSVTAAPSAAYFAIVAPVPIDSSSGWACTSRSLPRSSVVLIPVSLTAGRAAAPRRRDGRARRLAGGRLAGSNPMTDNVTDTFPRQQARTQRFTLGVPRSFEISPDGNLIAFLRSKGGSDPVNCLWLLDVATGQEHLIADPAQLGADGSNLDPEERARRERSREQAAGIVAFSCDGDFRLAVFGLSGRVYAADLTVPGTGGQPSIREIPALAPAADPTPDPAGRLVAYARGGALRVTDLRTGDDQAVVAPDAATDV